MRFGTFHDSAHLGDEYVEETGRERINYTREELISGIVWLPRRNTKLYTELGWAVAPARKPGSVALAVWRRILRCRQGALCWTPVVRGGGR